jgi:hypothetical protein
MRRGPGRVGGYRVRETNGAVIATHWTVSKCRRGLEKRIGANYVMGVLWKFI